MNFKLALIIFFTGMALAGCELIRIGTKPEERVIIDATQHSPLGAVYLFKIELDNHNVPAATRLLADASGRHYLAIEKYDMYYEVARMKRIVSSRPVTYITKDTVSENIHKINMEIDYLKTFIFKTEKYNDLWYITDYLEERYTQ